MTLNPLAPPTAEAVPLLLDARQVASLCCCSCRHIHRLRDGGRMPQPVRIGHLVRWRRADILGWIEAGCPKPERDAAIQSQTNNRGLT